MKKKNKSYKILIPIVLAGLMVLSWYSMMKNSTDSAHEFTACVEAARGYADSGMYSFAEQNYAKALEIRKDEATYLEIARMYREKGDEREYVDWCEHTLENFPTSPAVYECVLEAYTETGDYKNCFDVLETAGKRKITSDRINEIAASVMYAYKIDSSSYDDAGAFSKGISPVKVKNSWGFTDAFGRTVTQCRYSTAGAFSNSGFAPVTDLEGEAYFINTAGDKASKTAEGFASLGLYVSGTIAAEKNDGRYTYIDDSFKELFGDYEYASDFSEGVAAVRVAEGEWRLVGKDGKDITGETYSDVVISEWGIACVGGRIFASLPGGRYVMLDSTGKRVGSLEFDEAKAFLGNEPAAVRSGSEWYFVGADGNPVSDKKYEDAGSFSNGFAAVCVDGKWGFADAGENIVIEPSFDGAKSFSNKGSCFVKRGDRWSLLKIYRLNRE